ncbi:alpha/beta hydrolase [Microbacteriaceae bacterium VKM Ac-2854]|nr:alpha/beta hydrolase [Microbacteriaceae bacterium VKM Ac-2854]
MALWLGTACAGAAGLSIILGRRVVLPRPPRTVRIIGIDERQVRLERTAETTHPGTYGLWIDEDDVHLQLGRVHDAETDDGVVTRDILARTGGNATSQRGRFTGHLFHGPGSIGAPVNEVHIPVPGGIAPAWLFPAASDAAGGVWAIHIHGIRTSRITALRSVPAALEMGLPSLVVSFRGDGDGPTVPRGASSLGTSEWEDVDAAIAYAVDHGASGVLLFGWSLGGGVALQLTELSKFRSHIVGLILVAPTTDWRAIIAAGAQRSGLPAQAGWLATAALSDRVLSKLVGAVEPIDFDRLDWCSSDRLRVPALVLHSTGDRDVPFAISQRFADANPNVQLSELVSAPHGWEFNTDPQNFNRTIRAWYESLNLGHRCAQPAPTDTVRN